MDEDTNGAVKRRRKLDRPLWGVNSRDRARAALLAVVLAICACSTAPRTEPAQPPVERVEIAGAAVASMRAEPALVWTKRAGRGITAPLTVHDTVVIATLTDPGVAAFSTRTGVRHWMRRFRGAVPGPALLNEDRVFTVTGGREQRAHALDLARGRTIWSRRVGRVLVEPAIAGDTLYIASEDGELHAVSARSGDSYWEVRLGAAPAIAPVAVGASLLVATRRDTLLRIDRATGAVNVKVDLGSTPSARITLHRGLAILPLHSGVVVAIEPAGLAAAWRVTLPAPSLAPAAVAPDGDTYVVTRAAEVWRMAAEGGAPEPVIDLGGAVSGSFTLTRDGLLIGRLDGALFLVDFGGSIVWRRDFDDSIVAPVAAHNGAFYVPLLGGELVKLR